jgi:hypothetical protein
VAEEKVGEKAEGKAVRAHLVGIHLVRDQVVLRDHHHVEHLEKGTVVDALREEIVREIVHPHDVPVLDPILHRVTLDVREPPGNGRKDRSDPSH